MMIFCGIVVTLFLPRQARFRYEYEKGRIWMNKDLISPYSFGIQKTREEIEKDRNEISKSILPIYQNDTTISANELESFTSEFEVKWKNAKQPEKLKQKYLQTGQIILKEVYSGGVIGISKKFSRTGKHYNFTLLTNNIANQLNTLDVLTSEDAVLYINKKLEGYPIIVNRIWLKNLIKDHIQQNLIFDEDLTDKLEEETLNSISTTRGMVQKGELIVAAGSTITPEVYQKLESLRKAYEKDAGLVSERKQVFIGQLLLVGLALTLLMIFLYLFRKDIFIDNRKMALILVIITGMLIVLSLCIKLKIPSVYYIPYCIVPLIIRILFDTRLALNIHLLVVLIAGFFVPNSFEFAFLQITAGMVAIYSIKTLIRREQFLSSACLILATYFISYLGISLIRSGAIDRIEWENFLPFIFSVLLSLLAYPLIYSFEKLFRITSEVTLMEITNTNSKLLRDLSFVAPGTFQHSLQVANLAEAAIFKIGGNSLLVRAGALYHDIGKMTRPQYFIENQNTGINPHDEISYEESAKIIIGHVIKGLETAKRANLPEIVIDFIHTHHGTTRLDYFYQSFLKNFPEKIVDENIFRYPGPIPFSKETGVLMLADSVEAASRSLKEPTAQNINDLVERIITYKLEQGQLKNSNITLKDLEIVKEMFKSMLMSIYHVRIDYHV